MDRQTLDFWQQHSIHFLEMAFRTDKRERLQQPDGYGKRSGDCGDTVEIYLSIRDERLESVSFESNGCLNTVACANAVVYLAEGASLEEAWKITPERVAAYLETLPPHEYHCAEMAVTALHLALANAGEVKRAPWKKYY